MIIPKKVKVGGLIYTVVVVDKIDRENTEAGLIETEKQLITIQKGKPDFMRVTLLHELIHALNMEIEDKDIEFLAQGFYQIIKDNPKILYGNKR